ncbi:MAG TPA: helix-turn-helix domain-containing protein, partial [Mycobacterium sp.]|nr:helix-turn-helix domain-containing protein [Mycobacterium sp.]
VFQCHATAASTSDIGQKRARDKSIQQQSDRRWTTLEAAQLTGVHDRTIRRWIVAQRLPATRQRLPVLIDRLNLSMAQRSSPLNRREQSLVFRCPSLLISGQSAANSSVAHLNGMTVNTGAR